MAKIKTILREFENALRTNDFSRFLALVREDTKCLRARFGQEQKTLLHYMCSVNIADYKFKQELAESMKSAEGETRAASHEDEFQVNEDTYIRMLDDFISEFDALDLNVRDKNGNTPLHYAVSSGSQALVDVLLSYEDTDPDVENKSGVTPLNLASIKKFTLIEKKLLEETGQAVNEVVIPAGMSVKEYQKMKKQSIISLGSLKPIVKNGSKLDSEHAVESVLYIENEDLKSQFPGILKNCQANPILNTMIKMMGLCAVRGVAPEIRRLTLFGQQSELLEMIPKADTIEAEIYNTALAKIEKELGKRFKIICVDAEDTSSLKLFVPEPRGLYTNKNSVFVATKGLEAVEVLAVIMHESAHFIINQLFQNASQPFPNDAYSNPLREKFAAIVALTKSRLGEMAAAISTDKEHEAYKIIETVYNAYPSSEWAAELIVRVPQILVTMGPKEGQVWLEKNVPELLTYFEKEINPRIMEFMAKLKAQDYLSDVQAPSPGSEFRMI
ncbi:hypothetical protein AQUSIP_08610 [Aquicella siphonis]|uniref:Uncharacterized protein n=1 Tax=Aquicella siphonis TaxID=254247 RepID=A0A5E4PGY5_9COXI|nr:ankyrin repeat domain-containing protein [Aquicella siphonis]VVC75571.1 hypothetical protein AQUSIP_08610 [Aquicella siphonis]